MNGEVRLMLELDEFAWSVARERERINRGKVCVLVGPGGRVVCARRRSTTLEPASASMVGVRRYETQDAAGAAIALSIIAGRNVIPVDVYDFAKGRQYCARRDLQRGSA